MTAPAPSPRDARLRELDRLPKARLAAMYRRGVRRPDGAWQQWGGGVTPPERWRKDEVISSILEIEFPDTAP